MAGGANSRMFSASLKIKSVVSLIRCRVLRVNSILHPCVNENLQKKPSKLLRTD